MRAVVTLLLVLVLVGAEAALWGLNPLHVPPNFVPARAVGVELFRSRSPAMEPGIATDARVWVSSWPYWGANPQVGDIVAFVYPPDPSYADLKRVIATGGATVEIKNGVVSVDGHKLDEPYLHDSDHTTRLQLIAVHVPADSYFVMGDNRDVSEDSRNYGVIARANIIGKRWF